ncbi:ATP-binding protein [Mannheimia pernigra]|uniref:ATP-binding protein n=1 Tax=Mannheimia pernigra TaxID=111844 RepID=A0ABD7A621_9PAST|nr:ATP-binding protein [Mannheimia pernigra]QLB41522.1 ATP-binding protein [Mannheimia pernigra]
MKKQLPIGIQTFAKLRENNDYYYVDKTQKIIELINASEFIFLSRPRRFGKSLTLDTIAELFSANKPLFTGLYAEKNWDWEAKYPVIRFNFAKGVAKSKVTIEELLFSQLQQNAKQFGVALANYVGLGTLFDDLINKIVEKHQQKVVVLIDEYDKAILDNLENAELAIEMRDILRDFYSVIKGQDANIRFAMLTGVSKFSKINLFSGLNNLYDATFDKQFSALCGYTQSELESVFAPELEGVDLLELKNWYNGYNWSGESVYNPFDILLFFSNSDRIYKPYWFETGSPTFLIDKLIQENVDMGKISQDISDDMLLSKFDVGDISPIALMFQTGYLTIDKVINTFDGVGYKLKYPNKEVQQSLNVMLLRRYLHKYESGSTLRSHLYDTLIQHDVARMQLVLKAFFASIPHDWHRNNQIAYYEGYWASVFYAYFASLGFPIITEDATSVGNIDMTLLVNNHVYIFEFKVMGKEVKESPLGLALAQIIDRDYAKKYQGQGKTIYQIGVEFNKDRREVVFDVACL